MTVKRDKLPVLRVIGGEWRGRKLKFQTAEGTRPTTDRLRETLFNWLQLDIRGSRCLDLFAGSGALGFEAASRGASSVVMVEINPVCVRQLNQNIEQLQANQVEVIHASAASYLAGKPEPFDIVFVDPPFAKSQINDSCADLEQRGLLVANALVYVESPRGQEYRVAGGWSELKSSRVGRVQATLYCRA